MGHQLVTEAFSIDCSQLQLTNFVDSNGKKMSPTKNKSVSLWEAQITYKTQNTLDLTEIVTQFYSMQFKLQLLTLGAIAPVIVGLVLDYVYHGNPPFMVNTPTAKQLKRKAEQGEFTTEQKARFYKAEALMNANLPATGAQGQSWLETDMFLRDIRNPVAHSDADKQAVTKAMLLGLASADQIAESKQPFVNASINFLAKFTTKDQPLKPDKALSFDEVSFILPQPHLLSIIDWLLRLC